MGIRLGNFSVADIEDRVGVSFSDELVSLMESTHQAEAENIAPGRWHCFDLPFVLVCGDMETAQKINDLMSPQAKQFKCALSISLSR